MIDKPNESKRVLISQGARAFMVPLGRVVITQGAHAALEASPTGAAYMLNRHVTGDWGDVDSEDWTANDRALADGNRLLSVYHIEGAKFYVITEWDRSATTILLPEEY